MFPQFKNDANGVPSLYFDAAGTVSFGESVTDGTTLSLPVGLAALAAYEADGAAVALTEFVFTNESEVTAIDTIVAAADLDDEPTAGPGLYEITDTGANVTGDDVVASFQIDGTVAVFVAIVSGGTGYDEGEALLFAFSALTGVTSGNTTAAVSYIDGEVILTWGDDATASALPVRFEYSAAVNADAETNSQTEQEFTLYPPHTQADPTAIPTVPVANDGNAWHDENIPAGVTDDDNINEVDGRGVAVNYTVPDNNAENQVPADLPPYATKNWN